MDAIRDARALGMRDIPYSGYCRTCWNPVYVLWIDRDHGGGCPFGATSAAGCDDALSRARLVKTLAEINPNPTHRRRV